VSLRHQAEHSPARPEPGARLARPRQGFLSVLQAQKQSKFGGLHYGQKNERKTNAHC